MIRKLDISFVLEQTAIRRSHLERLTQMILDEKKELRLEAQECQICFYSQKIGGAMITRSSCIKCERGMTFSSTCKDFLCLDCAKEHRLCKHCGSDINLKNRRKL